MLWNDANGAVIEFKTVKRECTARFSNESLANSIYGPVKRNDNLINIALAFDCEGVTKAQILVAIYKKNPTAFINGKMNKLREGSVLIIPSTKYISDIKREEIERELNYSDVSLSPKYKRL